MISNAQRFLIPLAILMGLAGSVRGEYTANDYYSLWQLHLLYAERASERGDFINRDHHREKAKEMAEECLRMYEKEKVELQKRYPAPERTEPDIIRGEFDQKIDLDKK